jgi:hypothetical protein
MVIVKAIGECDAYDDALWWKGGYFDKEGKESV